MLTIKKQKPPNDVLERSMNKISTLSLFFLLLMVACGVAQPATQAPTALAPTGLPILATTPTVQPTRPNTPSAADKYGMTWGKYAHYDEFGIDLVGCQGQPRLDGTSNGPPCNPYQGDTLCSVALPILCLDPENLPRPNYAVSGAAMAMTIEYYYGWAGGDIGLTQPVVGTELTSIEVADSICAARLGPDYRMAEHHDGRYVVGMGTNRYYDDTWPSQSQLKSGGWHWYAYGNLPGNTRFWVNINDQPGNCWNSIPHPVSNATQGAIPPNATRKPEPETTPNDCAQGWSRLKVGSFAIVTGETDLPNRVRSGPSLSDEIIFQIYPGTIVNVIEGPICADGLVFWKVENQGIPGGSGWTAEGDFKKYWLEPYKP